MPTVEFAPWFEKVTGHAPHPWQCELGGSARCVDRLLRRPTGAGKTAGCVLSWLFHCVIRRDKSWPRRLVFCLPMRVLVEQSEAEIRGWLKAAGVELNVDVHVLMGGVSRRPWAGAPQRPAILITTQDMLLSRAVNRGYGTSRAMFSMEFALVHQDALWVLDEVQLMGVGLATSTQLAALREEFRKESGSLRPSYAWWMSATLQLWWFENEALAPSVPRLISSQFALSPEERKSGLFNSVKTLVRAPEVNSASAVAALAVERHAPGTLSLVVCNTVDRAVETFQEISRRLNPKPKRGAKPRPAGSANVPELRLVHSRFRAYERSEWRESFLSREANTKTALPAAGRIIIATQVLEAGVDISADLLITQLGPWASLVQRFGRVARYVGEEAEVIIVGAIPNERGAAPYAVDDYAASVAALDRIVEMGSSVSQRALEELEEDLAASNPGLLRRMYPYSPSHLLGRRDIEQLFDTSPDLSGSDIDVSRYIRDGDERDIQVFWRDLESTPRKLTSEEVPPPVREELCAVPFLTLRDWAREAPGDRPCYVFDYQTGDWGTVPNRRLLPGMTVLVPSRSGGYDPVLGWSRSAKDAVLPVAPQEEIDEPLSRGASAAESDALSHPHPQGQWETIGAHGSNTEAKVLDLAKELGISDPLCTVLSLAARWHDVGKGHEAFQELIPEAARQEAGGIALGRDLAKAPQAAWSRGGQRTRRGFRHELASTLALLELLRRINPAHPAISVERPLREALELAPVPVPDCERIASDARWAKELTSLSVDEFDLLAFLVCAHHGKVRCSWTSTPLDQAAEMNAIHGVRPGDTLPALQLRSADGEVSLLPEVELSLDAAATGLSERYGRSWTERVISLRKRHGPFVLAFLEALLRAADWQASGFDPEEVHQ